MLKHPLPKVTRIAVALVLVTVVLAAFPLSAQDAPVFSITVQATGTAIGLSSHASLEFGVQVVGTDLESAIDEVDEKMSAISEALGALDIAPQDIQSVDLQITSDDLLSPTTGAITGDLLFHVQSALHVIVRDVAQLQAIVRAAVSNGATSLGNLTLGVDNLIVLEQEARAAAIANAYERAAALATGFNLTLGEPVIVTETIANGGLPVPLSGSDLERMPLDEDAVSASGNPLILTVNIIAVFSTQPEVSDFTSLPPSLDSGFTGLTPEPDEPAN